MLEKDPANILVFVRRLGRPVFTTHDIVSISGRSPSTVVQCLNRLVSQGLLIKPYRGIWAETEYGSISAFSLIQQLFFRQRVYVSFITALHLHGIVEQIPQMITLASLTHSRMIRTSLGVYSLHQIAPDFFNGFDWYKGKDDFLIAMPEKALVDSLYLSSRRKKQFGHFPELHFAREFSFRKAYDWVKCIREKSIRRHVIDKLDEIQNHRP